MTTLITLKYLTNKLASISPMPDDDSPTLTETLLEEYAELIRKMGEIILIPDKKIINQLFESFGYGDGYEVYWPTVHLIEKGKQDTVLKIARRFLKNGSPGSRLWAAIILGRTRSPKEAETLEGSLNDEAERVRAQALRGLGLCLHPRTKELVEGMLKDPSEYVQDWAKNLLR